MNRLDMAVCVVLADQLIGVGYPNSMLYDWYITYCRHRDIFPASRVQFGMAMARFGAVKFFTNSTIGRCWYLPTPRERLLGIRRDLDTSCVVRQSSRPANSSS